MSFDATDNIRRINTNALVHERPDVELDLIRRASEALNAAQAIAREVDTIEDNAVRERLGRYLEARHGIDIYSLVG